MNRRELLKTAGLCLAAACLPKLEWGGEMRYGDLLAKLGSGQQLTGQELEALRLQGNNIENVANVAGAWASPSGGIDVDTVRANTANFDFMPMGVIRVQATSSATITSTGDQAANFESILTGGPESAFSWSADKPDRFYWNGNPHEHTFMFGGWVVWDANSSGVRAIKMYSYDDTDTPITYLGNQVAAIGGGNGTVQSWAFLWRKLKTEAYCRLMLYQDGAGGVGVGNREVWGLRVH